MGFLPDFGGGRSTRNPDGSTTSTADSGGGGSGTPDILGTGLSLFTGIGAGAGLVGGLLDGIFGGSKRERVEDPITTEALKRLTSARDSITNVDPEANRRMTDQSLSQQQEAAVDNALDASTANLANNGVGGDIGAPMAGAIANSTAAIGAAGQFAGARTQNNMHALDAELERSKQLTQNASIYGDQASQVNLLETRNKNAGSTLLNGIAGMGSGAGVFNQIGTVGTKDKYRNGINVNAGEEYVWK